MEMIDLSRLEPQETLNHTSKGNQLKWKCDGYWYKADHMGCLLYTSDAADD